MNKDKKESSGKSVHVEKVVLTLLVVLIFALGFSGGVVIGKNFSDREYAMKSIDHKAPHATAAHDEEGDDSEMTDEEATHAANEAMGEAEHAPAPTVGKDGKVLPSQIAEHGKSPVDMNPPESAAKIQMAKTDSHGAAKKEEERTPSSLKPVTHAAPAIPAASPNAPKLQYTVQVASYPDLKDAENMAVSLVKKGYPAFPFTVEIKGQTWHRVSIGGFKTKKEAQELQSEMTKQGIIKDSVVQKITR